MADKRSPISDSRRLWHPATFAVAPFTSILDTDGTVRRAEPRDCYSALMKWSDPQVSLAWVKVTHPIDLTLRAYWAAMGETT